MSHILCICSKWLAAICISSMATSLYRETPLNTQLTIHRWVMQANDIRPYVCMYVRMYWCIQPLLWTAERNNWWVSYSSFVSAPTQVCCYHPQALSDLQPEEETFCVLYVAPSLVHLEGNKHTSLHLCQCIDCHIARSPTHRVQE